MSSKSSRIDFLQSRPSLTTSAAANPKIHHESNSHSNLNHDDDGHDEWIVRNDRYELTSSSSAAARRTAACAYRSWNPSYITYRRMDTYPLSWHFRLFEYIWTSTSLERRKAFRKSYPRMFHRRLRQQVMIRIGMIRLFLNHILHHHLAYGWRLDMIYFNIAIYNPVMQMITYVMVVIKTCRVQRNVLQKSIKPSHSSITMMIMIRSRRVSKFRGVAILHYTNTNLVRMVRILHYQPNM